MNMSVIVNLKIKYNIKQKIGFLLLEKLLSGQYSKLFQKS